MNAAQFKSLRRGDLVTWNFTGSLTDSSTPGTVIATDAKGVFIYWSDGLEHPTHYEWEEEECWSSITLVKSKTNHGQMADPRPHPERRKLPTQ